jgi:site-specific DNA-cytosine methylase
MLDLGLTIAGFEHAFFCESDPWRREILEKRYPEVPIFDDVRVLDGSAPRVDLLVGGFPCRGASSAGKREGLDNPETALWREFARIIGELRPRLLLLENVSNLLAVTGGRAWGEVCGDLAESGYVFAWDCLPAAAFGAPHLRDRVFLVAAHADQAGRIEPGDGEGSGISGARRPAIVGAGPAGSTPSRETGRTATPPAQLLPTPTRGDSKQSRNKTANSGGGLAGPCGDDVDGLRLRDEQWGPYAGAIQRWEEVAGPAPEPLLRGVDARDARRLARSQLSALGDGVHLAPAVFLGCRVRQVADEFARGGVEA